MQADIQFLRTPLEEPSDVVGSVVGQDVLDHHAHRGEYLNGPLKKADGGVRLLVRERFHLDAPGVVVHSHVNKVLAPKRTPDAKEGVGYVPARILAPPPPSGIRLNFFTSR